jgi:hypothetical protein
MGTLRSWTLSILSALILVSCGTDGESVVPDAGLDAELNPTPASQNPSATVMKSSA